MLMIASICSVLQQQAQVTTVLVTVACVCVASGVRVCTADTAACSFGAYGEQV